MKRSSLIKKLITAGATLAAAAMLLTGCGSAETETEAETHSPVSEEGVIYFEGKRYVPNRDITTVLFLGIDDAESVVAGNTTGLGGRSDTMALFILDSSTEQMRILAIPRDTMTEVDVYDANGDYIYSGDMQICMQHSFGDSRLRSAFITDRTVSELLYGTDIDYHFTMTMDGIAQAVDAIGGIDLVMRTDCTDVDSSYTEGAEVHLDGATAERFIRSRDCTEVGSAQIRLERQIWFVEELFATINASGHRMETLSGLLEAAEEYTEVNADADTLSALMTYSLDTEVRTVPGEVVAGTLHDEFHVDEDGLMQMIIDLLYVAE